MIRLTSRTVLLTSLCGLIASCMTPEPVAPPEIRVERVTVVPNRLRPPVMGPNAGVSAGHPLTAAAALDTEAVQLEERHSL